MEKLAESQSNPKSNQYNLSSKERSVNPGRKNQINSHQQKDLSPTIVFVYVDPYSHELKILPTIRLAHQFQNMKYVGILKSFCTECKIKSPQNTISVKSQTKQTEKTVCRMIIRLPK